MIDKMYMFIEGTTQYQRRDLANTLKSNDKTGWNWGAWVAQSLEHLPLFRSSQGPRIKPGSLLRKEFASPSPSALSPLLVLSQVK